MLDRLLALLAIAVFAAFLGIIFFKVARVDLGVVILIGVGLVTYDIWNQLFRRRT